MSDLIIPESSALDLASIPEDIRARVLALQSKIKDNVRITGNKIAIQRSGLFRLPDGTEAEEVTAIVISYRYRNNYYVDPFKQNEYKPPVCWAVGFENNEHLTPSPNSTKLQANSCATCKKNEYASAPNGRGKACSNSIQLAVMMPGMQSEDVFLLNASATSIRKVEPFLLQTSANGLPLQHQAIFSIDLSSGYSQLNVRKGPPNTLAAEYIRFIESADMVLSAEPIIEQASANAPPTPVKPSGREARA